jgi:hypothetical protein
LLNEERASVSERIQVRDQLFVLDRWEFDCIGLWFWWTSSM